MFAEVCQFSSTPNHQHQLRFDESTLIVKKIRVKDKRVNKNCLGLTETENKKVDKKSKMATYVNRALSTLFSIFCVDLKLALCNFTHRVVLQQCYEGEGKFKVNIKKRAIRLTKLCEHKWPFG